MSDDIVKYSTNIIGAFILPVAAGKNICDFVKEQKAKRYKKSCIGLPRVQEMVILMEAIFLSFLLIMNISMVNCLMF